MQLQNGRIVPFFIFSISLFPAFDKYQSDSTFYASSRYSSILCTKCSKRRRARGLFILNRYRKPSILLCLLLEVAEDTIQLSLLCKLLRRMINSQKYTLSHWRILEEKADYSRISVNLYWDLCSNPGLPDCYRFACLSPEAIRDVVCVLGHSDVFSCGAIWTIA